jgi:hypothetical protein
VETSIAVSFCSPPIGRARSAGSARRSTMPPGPGCAGRCAPGNPARPRPRRARPVPRGHPSPMPRNTGTASTPAGTGVTVGCGTGPTVTIWRRCRPHSAAPHNEASQRRQRPGMIASRSSGSSIRLRDADDAPGCLPGLRPERTREERAPACPTGHPRTTDARSSTNPRPAAASTPRSHQPAPPRSASTPRPTPTTGHTSAPRARQHPGPPTQQINPTRRGPLREIDHTPGE